MTFDLGADLALAKDIASVTSDSAHAVYAGIVLYRAKGVLAGVTGPHDMLAALDKANLLLPAVDADITLAPVVRALLADPQKKARLFSFMATV